MQKNKIIALLAGALLFGFTSVANGASVAITQLPGYINYTDFKIACSALGATTAQFSSRKDSGSYTNFGSLIDLNTTACQTQVTGTQFGSEGKFFFKVILNDGTFAETSTTLDTTATSNVTDFGKERMNSGTTYKVHWKNPLESDFVKVLIYRGTELGFIADDSHKVAEVGGNPGDTQNWNDNGLDATKEYYYLVRALDHANNSSGLVGDGGGISSSSQTTGGRVLGSSTGGSGNIVQLPKETVLGETGASPSASAEATSTADAQENAGKSGLVNWIQTHKKISLGILLLVGILAYFRFKKKK